MLGVKYSCSSHFDATFYRKRYGFSSPPFFSDSDLEKIAKTEGIRQGHQLHSGSRTFKIVVMTKDEWPLIRSWVLYHAHIFGGENIYILDGSSNTDQISFLREASRRLGVVVFFSQSNLHELQTEVNTILSSLSESSDFLTKCDSDEFIVRLEYSSHSDLLAFSSSGVRDVVNRLPIDGKRYKFTYYSHSVPITNCSFGDDPALTTFFEHPWKTTLKTFFASGSFESTDIGNHNGKVREPPFSNDGFHATDLAIAHFHYGCFDVRMFNTKKALLSLKFISESDSNQEQIAKLIALDTSKVNSGHKVSIYLEFLTDPAAFRLKNEHRSTSNTNPHNKEVIVFHGIRSVVEQKMCEWDGQCDII